MAMSDVDLEEGREVIANSPSLRALKLSRTMDEILEIMAYNMNMYLYSTMSAEHIAGW